MANIKITELNGITKKASDDVLAIVDVSADETKKIAVGDLLDKNVELIAVSDIEPAECSYGDKYYNTEDNLIYTAIANNTWGEDGEEPIEGIFYVVFGEQSSYAYNGTTLISVGGGTEDIIISDTQPTGNDWKLWIDSNEVGSQASEITNEYSESTGLGYSANYINNLKNYQDYTSNLNTIGVTGNVSCESQFGICCFTMGLRSSSGDIAAYTKIVDGIPKPKYGLNFNAVNGSGSTIRMQIGTDGAVYVANVMTTSSNYLGTISYVIDEANN